MMTQNPWRNKGLKLIDWTVKTMPNSLKKHRQLSNQRSNLRRKQYFVEANDADEEVVFAPTGDQQIVNPLVANAEEVFEDTLHAREISAPKATEFDSCGLDCESLNSLIICSCACVISFRFAVP